MDPGTRLDHYEIIGPLGAGGMGEVYRARDTNLKREVAIKVLPQALAADQERLARLEREAHLLAALNHVNIASIHSLERDADTRFLVLELVEGETLAERLKRGPLPVEEALAAAKQIAEALEAAHEKGIIHRDLKPANVMLTAAGHIKVLDFGLAKAFEVEGTQGDLTQSPTITVAGTKAGVIQGTAPYMSPEQARGLPVDKRTDIWAFGCVVFEMLTGKRAFQGETVTDILAAIVHQEPQWEALPPDTPLRIRDLLGRCLKKEADERLRDVGECRIAVKEYLADPEGEKRRALASAGTTTARGIPWMVGVPVAVAILLVGVLGTWWATRPEPPAPQPLKRFAIALPEGDHDRGRGTWVAISPDGTSLVYAADAGGGRQLHLRPMDRFGDATPIPGTEGAERPFFSNDGEWVGFSAGGDLKRVSLAGGELFDLCDDCAGAGDWSPLGDTIIFGQGGSLWQIPAVGGEPALLAEPDAEKDEVWYDRPEILPDGNAVLFQIRRGVTGPENDGIAVLSMETMDVQIVAEEGTDPLYAESGHVIYARGNVLFSVAFDPRSLSVAGQPRPIVQDVSVRVGGASQFGISSDGTLVYVPGTTSTEFAESYQLAWVGRDGEIEPLPFEPREFAGLELSPNGRRVALEIEGTDEDGDSDHIWIYDVEREGSEAVLTTEGDNENPVWSPDGVWVFFASTRGGNFDIWKRRVDGSGPAQLVLDLEAPVRPAAISENGMLLFNTGGGPSGFARDGDGGILALDTGQEPNMLFDTPAVETMHEFSPDGRFFAYSSDKTGELGVYVQEVEGERGYLVSTSTRGGIGARWSQDGRQIYYAPSNGPGILVAEVDSESFSASAPVEISDIGMHRDPRFGINFDVTDEGQRFLVRLPANDSGPHIRVILNWFEELKERVPTGR